MSTAQTMGYPSQYPYLEALVGRYEIQGVPSPTAPPVEETTEKLYPTYNPITADAPPPTWGGEETAQTYCKPQYELVVNNTPTAVPLYQRNGVSALPLPPPTNPEIRQPDQCIFCRTVERINRLSSKVCNIVKGPLKLLGGTAFGMGATALGAGTFIGAATTGTLFSIGSPTALLTGGVTLVLGGCTYKCAKASARLFAAGFKDLKSLF